MEGMKNMGNMVKIRDISVRYNISARALRYYEDMELMESTRSDDYAYRLYDEAAIKVTWGAMAYDELFGKFQLWQEAHNDFYQPII